MPYTVFPFVSAEIAFPFDPGITQLAYAQEVLKDLPIFYGRLASSGADSSLYVNTATAFGTPTYGAYSTGPLTADTAAGYAILNGTSQYYTTAAAVTSGWSVEAFYKTTSAAGLTDLFDSRSGSPGIALRVEGGTLRAYMWDVTSSTYKSIADVATTNDNAWHHVAVTWDGVTMRLYRDGVERSNSGALTVSPGLGIGFTIGRQSGASAEYFPGNIAEAAIYARTVTATRVAAHYAARTLANPLVDVASLPWRNVSRYLTQFGTRIGRQHELNRMETGTAQARFRDPDRRFEPEYVGGTAVALTVTGTEITDTSRSLAKEGDGRVNDSSFGIWAATTNLIINGGFETNTATGGWGVSGAGSTTISRDTTRSLFGGASMKVVCGGVAVNEGTALTSFVVSASTTYTGSMWVYSATGGAVVQIYLERFTGAGAYLDSALSATYTLVAGWQRLTLTGTTTASTGQLDFIIRTRGTGAAQAMTVWVDGVQVEQHLRASPYVHTDGATATRALCQPQAAVTLINKTQMWVAARVRPSWAGVNPLGGAQNPRIFSWRGASGYPQSIELYYSEGAAQWSMTDGTAGSAVVNAPHAAGDLVTVIGKVTAGQISVSVNGAPFVNAARGTIANPPGTMFDIGTLNGLGAFEGEVLWFACGTGILTDADAVTLSQRGAFAPDTLSLPLNAALTMRTELVTASADNGATPAPYSPYVIPMRRVRLRAAYPLQLVPNGSFERNANGNITPWTVALTGSATATHDSNGDGLGSLGMTKRVSATTAGGATDSATWTSDYIPVREDVPCTLSALFYKSAAVTTRSQLRLDCYDDTKALLGSVYPRTAAAGVNFAGGVFTPTSGAWQKWGGIINVYPPNTRYVRVVGVAFASDSVSTIIYMDSVALTPGVTAFADSLYYKAGLGDPFYDASDAWNEVYNGYIEEWGLNWPQVKRAFVDLNCVDGFEPLAQTNLGIVFPVHLTGTRVKFALDAAGYPRSERSIQTGQVQIQSVNTTSSPVQPAQVIGDATDTEAGVFFFSPAGIATFEDRADRITGGARAISVATFGDGGPASNETPYLTVKPAYGIQQVYNRVLVTANGLAQQVAEDATSKQQYWTRELSKATLHISTSDSSSYAGVLLGKYKQPALRIDAMDVDAIRDTAALGQVVVRAISDRITVVRRPYVGGPALVRAVHIEAIAHNVTLEGAKAWRTSYQLSPADTNTYWVLDSSAMDTGTRIAF